MQAGLLTFLFTGCDQHSLYIHGPEVIKLFSCSTHLSMKFLLINMKMPIAGISYLLAENFSCSAMFSKKEFAIVNNWGFISRTNFMLS